jgi:hypothetical protein
MDKDTKPDEGDYSWEAVQTVYEGIQQTEMIILEVVKRTMQERGTPPTIIDRLQRDFDAYAAVELELFKQSRGRATMKDVKARLPGNAWIALAREIAMDLEKRGNVHKPDYLKESDWTETLETRVERRRKRYIS